MSRNFLVIEPEEGLAVLKGLASSVRVQMLKLLHEKGPMNVNDIANVLLLPQSTVSTNIQVLEDCGLIRTENQKAKKGNQKICYPTAEEVLVVFKSEYREMRKDTIEVSMPIGLYTGFEVTAPCGLCSPEGIIGLLDVPNAFLDPDRMKAGLLWFTRGFVEYQFPNNAKLSNMEIQEIEVVMELSSEVPGTSADWPSDITLSINGKDVGVWMSPGDFGDKRGVFTPVWWKLKGSQYGKLKNWRIARDGTYVDGVRISDVTITELDLVNHHSIRVRIGVYENAAHPGGINIFGKGFGNYDQDILLRLKTS
ncbi:ArsR family transcriptional regulator [Pararhizobium sp. LjRoot235]|uniref:ArsR/SmtB family transcription factor n=1 Tax=Pararhizobium sp. LjRoot235 TaxID=3342291 RepID=UPI003ED10656